MEETNYSRSTITGQESQIQSGTETPVDLTPEAKEKQLEKGATVPSSTTDVVATPTPTPTKVTTKTFMQKIRLFEPGSFSKPNKLGGMMLRPLIFLSFPVIFYSGFSYGSNLGKLKSSLYLSFTDSSSLVQRFKWNSFINSWRNLQLSG